MDKENQEFYFVTHTDNFNLGVECFETKEMAYRFIEETIKLDKFASKDKIAVFKGSRVFFEIKETVNVEIVDDGDVS